MDELMAMQNDSNKVALLAFLEDTVCTGQCVWSGLLQCIDSVLYIVLARLSTGGCRYCPAFRPLQVNL